MSRIRIVGAIGIFLLLSAPVPAGDVVTDWNALALDIMKQEFTHPPKVGRDLAIVHTAIWDAIAAVDGGYHPILTRFSPAPSASMEAAVSSAARDSLTQLYPTRAAETDAFSAGRLAGIADGPARAAGIAMGQAAASATIRSRQDDGWDSASAYTWTTEPGGWRPTPPQYNPPLAPHWGDVRTFALPGAAGYMPPPPPPMTSLQYAAAWQEVKDVGGAVSGVRTTEQTQIAEFWNDVPGNTAAPPGKWNLIASVLSAAQGNDLVDNARMFALLNVAMADGGVVCWKAKYDYDLWRPGDAVRLADQDGNDATEAEEDWQPLWPSPPFPAYSSGHSTFSGAGSKVLEMFFGQDDIAFASAAGWDVLPGVTREFASLSEAAEEAGMSRIYGGIHFQFDNEAGLVCGRDIATFVYGNVAQPIPEPGVVALIGLGMTLMLRQRASERPRGQRL